MACRLFANGDLCQWRRTVPLELNKVNFILKYLDRQMLDGMGVRSLSMSRTKSLHRIPV